MDFSIFLQLPIHVQTGQDHCCDSQLLNEGDLGVWRNQRWTLKPDLQGWSARTDITNGNEIKNGIRNANWPLEHIIQSNNKWSCDHILEEMYLIHQVLQVS